MKVLEWSDWMAWMDCGGMWWAVVDWWTGRDVAEVRACGVVALWWLISSTA